MKKMTITLGQRNYPITISSGLLNHFDSFEPLKKGDQGMLVTNQTLAPLYLSSIRTVLEQGGVRLDHIILPDGEKYKSLASIELIFTELLKKWHGRHTTLIAFGGGVIGDLTGFAAACYQRGIRYIQIPTTLLAQVDASIGGKTAVNHQLGKNMIGAFYQPASVIIDIDCLSHLPLRHFSSGLAEAIKYGIAFDFDFFCWLEANMDSLLRRDVDALSHCISRCCQIKSKIVMEDERDENGLRALLNLGHTYAHAIETETNYIFYLHGEAVSIGMLMAAQTAQKLGLFSKTDIIRIKKLLLRAKLPIQGFHQIDPKSCLLHMMHDKKVMNGKLRLIIPTSIGQSEIYEGIDNEIVLASIKETLILSMS